MAPTRQIAFVAPRYAEGPTVGGAETLLRNLAIRVAQSGYRVTFLTTCAKNHFTWANEIPPGARESAGMTVRFFPVDTNRDLGAFLKAQERISRGIPVDADEERTWLTNNVNSAPLQAYLRDHADQFDRIVMGPYLFGLIHAAAGVAPRKTLLVPCLHDEPFAYLAAFRSMFAEVSACLFNTEPERDLAVRLYGIEPPRCRVVGMGLDDVSVDASVFAARRGLTAPYVLYSGRREPLKGTPLLLDYMAAFRARTGRDVKLVLTGAGPIEPCAELAPHVIDVGFVTEQEKHEAMAGATAFCHPSTNESLGIVLLESWLARTPCLVHAAGAVLRYQCRQSQGGLWFRTYPEFEEELTVLLDNPSLRCRLGENGRAYVLKEYGWDAVGKRLLAAIEA